MKTAKRILFGAMAALAMVGCSDDKLEVDPNKGHLSPSDEDGVFLSVNIKMPTTGSSRSFTDGDNSSNDGTEEGQDYENTVRSVFVVLAHPSDNKFIAWGEIPSSNITKTTSTTDVIYNSTAKISKTELQEYYTTYPDVNDREVNVFVFCNPTSGLRDLFEEQTINPTTDWVDATGTYDQENNEGSVIWSNNDFLMSNISIAKRSLPKTMEEWAPFTVKTSPFKLSGENKILADNLPAEDPLKDNYCNNGTSNSVNPGGPIKVERTAARFDFKDGSKGDCTYDVVYNDVQAADEDKVCYVQVKLHKMSLTNMNKTYYYLRRVSDTGFGNKTSNDINGTAPGYQLCGPEKPWYTDAYGHYGAELGNYVVNPLARIMETPIGYIPEDATAPTYPIADYFNYPFFNLQGEIDLKTIDTWYTTPISMVLGNKTDQKNEYHIWRYVTENTIPTVELQKNGQSTGIIFKAKMIATEDANIVVKTGKKYEDLTFVERNIQDLYNLLKPNAPLETDNTTGDNTNSEKNPIIYKFDGVKNDVSGMYASWPNIREAAIRAAVNFVWEASNDPQYGEDGGYFRAEVSDNSLFQAVFGRTGGFGTYTYIHNGKPYEVKDPNPYIDPNSPNSLWEVWDKAGKPASGSESNKAFKNAAVAAGIALYQTSYDGEAEDNGGGVGYYCYYYYWNRHNDNGQNMRGIMGPMEFAVVRNNVYKISVNSISNIGHPRLSENDPEPPTPNTDDEIDNVYLDVEVQVLPWVVRINQIDF